MDSMGRKKVISKIRGLGKEIVRDIRNHESPRMKVPQRGLGNVIFDERKNILRLGDKKSTRSFMNIAHSKKFMQTILIASKCEELLERNKTASIRELYYQLKHTIANTKENTFDDQSESVCPDEPLLVRIDDELKILPGSEVIEYAEKTGKKIFDENGKVRITDVDLKVCAFDSEQKIKEHKVVMVMKHPSKKIRRIKTSSGREVKVTPYHSLFTLDDGEVKSIEVDKLGIGSYVALPRRIRINPNNRPINVVEVLIKNAPDDVLNKIYLKGERTTIDRILRRIGKESLKKFSEKYKNVWTDMTANWKHWKSIPISLVKETSVDINDLLAKLKISCRGSRHKYNTIIRKDENLGVVLGYLISEGGHASLDRKRNERHIAISNKSHELLSEFINAFNATFGDRTASPKPVKSRDGVYKLNLGYNLLSYILEYVFGYRPVHAWEKEVPSVILDAPESCIKGFLRGFRLGDGSIFIKKPRIRYHTTSTSIVNGLVFLLLRLGIFPNIYHYNRAKRGHHDIYEIRIGSREYVKIDRIPNIGKLINDMRRSCSQLKEKDYRKFDWNGIENKKRTISRTTLKNIIKTLQPYNPDPRYFNILNELANGDIYWDRVVSIEEAELPPYTLDLAVNPTQNFIGGNGLLILHNSDPLIVDLETMLGTLREELHLKADDKGTIIGNIVIEDSGDLIDCSKLGRSGLAIPSIVEHYKFRKVKADYVLVIETGAMFDRLVEEKFHLKNNCIMISTKGQAARGCRRLIHRLYYELGLPIIAFTDGDPWGYYIYSVLKAGSMALAHESVRLGTPGIRFVGMTMTDVEEYGLQKVTEKLKDVDKKRIDELLQYPWFQKKEWRKQLDMMQKMGVRIEQQALASKSLEFVAEEYLPEKIKNKDLLP